MFTPGFYDKTTHTLPNDGINRNGNAVPPPTTNRFVGISPLSDESQQNIRIQLAVHRYNSASSLPLRVSSDRRQLTSPVKLNLFTSPAKRVTKDIEDSPKGKDTFNRYHGVGDFPIVKLNKPTIPRRPLRLYKSKEFKVPLPDLPANRFLSNLQDESSDFKSSTRSVLDVLQDLSRKRIHSKDDDEGSSSKKLKGLGGDMPLDLEAPYKPLFVPKLSSSPSNMKSKTTQTMDVGTTTSDLENDKNSTGNHLETPEDPKAALRRQLAKKNNEISASLSSSLSPRFIFKNGSLISPKQSEQLNKAKKKNKTLDKISQETATPKTTPVVPDVIPPPDEISNTFPKKIHVSPRTSPNSDRLMTIFLEMQDTPVKSKVFEDKTIAVQAKLIDTEAECKVMEAKEVTTDKSVVVPTSTVEVSDGGATTPKASLPVTTSPAVTNLISPPLSLMPSVNFKLKTPPAQPSTEKPLSFTAAPFTTNGKKSETEAALSTSSPFKFGETTASVAPSISEAGSKDPVVSSSIFSFGKKQTSTQPEESSTSLKPPLFSFCQSPTNSDTKSPEMNKIPPTFQFGKPTADRSGDGIKVASPLISSALATPPNSLFGGQTSGTSLLFGAQTSSPSISATTSLQTGTIPTTVKSSLFTNTLSQPTLPSGQTILSPSQPTSSPGIQMTTPVAGSLFTGSTTKEVSTVVSLTSQSQTDAPFTAITSSLFSGSSGSFSGNVPGKAGSLFSSPTGNSNIPTTTVAAASVPSTCTTAITTSNTFLSNSAASTISNSPFGTVPVKKSETPSFGSLPVADNLFGNIFSTPVTTVTSSAFGTQSSSLIFGQPPLATSTQTSAPVPTSTTLPGVSAIPAESAAPVTTSQSVNSSNTPASKPSFSFGQNPVTSLGTANSNLFSFGKAPSTSLWATKTEQPGPPTTETQPPALLGTFRFGSGLTATTVANASTTVTSAQTTTAPPTFGQTSTTFSFGQNNNNKPVFGQSTGSTFFSQSSTPNVQATPAFAQPSSQPLTFGPSSTQPSAFGESSSQPPVFGQATSQPPAFGQSTSLQPPAFGQATTQPPAFGQTSSSQPPTFGQSASQPPAFGQNPSTQPPTFGQTTSQTPVFGQSTLQTPAFGQSTSQAPAFGQSTVQTPAFGQSNSQPAVFGQTATQPPVFGQSTSQLPAFGQTEVKSTFGSTPSAQATPFAKPSGFGVATTQANQFSFGASTSGGSAASTTSLTGFPAAPVTTTAFSFGSSTPAASSTAPTPTFGATNPQQGVFGFGSSSSTSTSTGGTSATSQFSFGGNQTSQPFKFPSSGFNFNAGSSTAKSPTPVFSFGSNQPQAQQQPQQPQSTPVFGFGGSAGSTPGSVFSFGSSSSGSNVFTPGASATPSPAFPVPGVFSIGSGSSGASRQRQSSRLRRRT